MSALNLGVGEAFLRRRRADAATAVSYYRGMAVNAAVPAIQANTEYETDDGEAIVKSASADWLIERADLMLDLGAGAVEVTPQAGDRINITLDHGTEVFEVAPLGADDVYRWHGRDGQTFRIHTVRVASSFSGVW